MVLKIALLLCKDFGCSSSNLPVVVKLAPDQLMLILPKVKKNIILVAVLCILPFQHDSPGDGNGELNVIN